MKVRTVLSTIAIAVATALILRSFLAEPPRHTNDSDTLPANAPQSVAPTAAQASEPQTTAVADSPSERPASVTPGLPDPAAADSGGSNPATPENVAARSWPVSPRAMETIILNELNRVPGVPIISIDSSECTESVCEILMQANSLTALAAPGSEFPDVLTSPPYSALFYLEARPLSTGTVEFKMSFRTEPRPPPTTEALAERRRQEAANTRRFAANALPAASYGAEPVVFGTRNGAEQIVEDVCSHDCPLDGQRIIYLDVPNGQTCSQLDGTEHRVTTRSRDGSFADRVFCVPNFLIGDPADTRAGP